MDDQPRRPDADRFWARVDRRAPNECWPWRGALHVSGYGSWQSGRTNYPAHRLAYEYAIGPIPARTHLFHTCDLRSCVNPDHLRPVLLPDMRAKNDKPITPVEIAWAAGIWEGEGSCWPNARTRLRGAATTHANVTQRDPERWVLERLRFYFGGSIGLEDTTDPESCFRWAVTGARARGFLMTIYVFLSPWRRELVRVALARSKSLDRKRDVCKRGHPLVPGNVIAGSYRRRQCKTCVRTNRQSRHRIRYRTDPAFRARELERGRAYRMRRGTRARTP